MRRARPDRDTDDGRRQSQRDGDRRATSTPDTTTREAPLAALHRAGGNQAVQSAVGGERVARSGAGSHALDTTSETDRETRKTGAQTAEGETETQRDQTRTLSRRESALEGAIQPKLEVSNPTDRYEREADRVAAAVLEGESEAQPRTADGTPTIQRMCSRCRERYRQDKPLDCKECEAQLQRATDAGGDRTLDDDSGVAQQIRQARSGGRHLPGETRSFFESQMGRDFGDVRVHTGPQADRAARSVNARAFTLGSDVVFRSGEYRPETRSGKRLLAHELTHVVQQGGGHELTYSGAEHSDASYSSSGTDVGIQRRTDERVQRWWFGGTRAVPLDPPSKDHEIVPKDERSRVTKAMNIVERIADSPEEFERCNEEFESACGGGGLNAVLREASVWKGPPERKNGKVRLGSHTEYKVKDTDMEFDFGYENISYTEDSYRKGKWSIAATFIHELAHACDIDHRDTPSSEKMVEFCGLTPPEDEGMETEKMGHGKIYYLDGKPDDQMESETVGPTKIYHLKGSQTE